MSGVIDLFGTSGQRDAQDAINATEAYVDRLDGDVDRGLKAGKIAVNTRSSLGYRWKLFTQDWNHWRLSVVGPDGTGINSFNADQVKAKALDYRKLAEGYAAEVSKAMGGDVTPPPPKSTTTPSSGIGVGELALAALVLGGLYLAFTHRGSA